MALEAAHCYLGQLCELAYVGHFFMVAEHEVAKFAVGAYKRAEQAVELLFRAIGADENKQLFAFYLVVMNALKPV